MAQKVSEGKDLVWQEQYDTSSSLGVSVGSYCPGIDKYTQFNGYIAGAMEDFIERAEGVTNDQ